MLTHKIQLEVVKQERKYLFFCDNNSALPEVIDVLTEMRMFAMRILDDAMKQQEQHKEELEKAQQEPQVEAEKQAE